MKMKQQDGAKPEKRNPLLLLLVFAAGAISLWVLQAAALLSLPKAWEDFTHHISSLSGSLSERQAEQIGAGLLAAGLLLLAVVLAFTYRKLRGRVIAPEEIPALMPDLGQNEAATMRLLMNHGVTMRVPSQKPPRRWPYALPTLLIAAGTAMVLFDPVSPVEPPVAISGNQPVTVSKKPDGQAGGEKDTRRDTPGESSSSQPETIQTGSEGSVPLKGKGTASSACPCPPGSGGGGSSSFQEESFGTEEEFGTEDFGPEEDFEEDDFFEPEEEEEEDFFGSEAGEFDLEEVNFE